MKCRSGGVESDLEPLCPDGIEQLRSEPEVAPGFQKPESNVFGRAHAFGKGFSKETTPLDELKKSVSDLQEKIEDLAGCFIVAVDMFQFKSPVLLDIEALIFYFPSISSSVISHRDGPCPGDTNVGDPLKPGGLDLSILIRFGLKALENGQGMLSLFRIYIKDVVDPPVLLIGSGSFPCAHLQVIVRLKFLESLELLLYGREVVLVDDHILPAIPFAQIEGGSSGKQAVQTHTDGKTREPLLEPLRQTVECLELTVLLAGILTRIFYELRHKGESKPIRGDQLCLHHLVIVDGLFSVSLGEAVRTVPLIESQDAGSIDSHHIVDAKESPAIEHLLSDEGLCHPGDGFLPLFGVEPGEEVIEGVPMGNGIDIEQDLELLTGGLVVSELVSDLSSGSEPEQEHQNPHKAKGGQRIDDLALIPWVPDASEQGWNAPKEMLYRLDQNADQSLLLLHSPVYGGLFYLKIGKETFFECVLLSITVPPVREKISLRVHIAFLYSFIIIRFLSAKKCRSSGLAYACEASCFECNTHGMEPLDCR